MAVRYTKWGGIDHWHFELEPLGQDRFGWWFFGRKGLTQQRGAEPPIVLPRDFVLLVPVQAAGPRTSTPTDELEIYVNVTTRPVLGAGTVRRSTSTWTWSGTWTAGSRCSTRTSSPSTRCSWATRPR